MSVYRNGNGELSEKSRTWAGRASERTQRSVKNEMECPKCSLGMKKIKDFKELPAVPWEWYKYHNYLEVTSVYYCVDCKIMRSFGKTGLIVYYIKNIIKEVKSMLGF